MQTRLGSFIEAVINLLVGFFVAVIGQTYIFPLFDIYISIYDNVFIAEFFTTLSLVRSYTLRILFNWFHGKQ